MSKNRHPSRSDEPVILCIDDDPDVSEAIALRLRTHGAKVLRAFHGMHGLSLAMTRRPDLVITDLRMPQGGGCHIIERLRNHVDTCRLPIIVLTGQRHVDPTSMAPRLRVDQFLTKPIHFDDLAAAISKFVPLNAKRRL